MVIDGVSIISAVALNNVIGCDNKLPWHLPKDLQYFKNITNHKTIVMGRRTCESITNVTKGKPLSNRKNVVLTSDKNYKKEGFFIVNTLDDILNMAKNEDIVVIGGAAVYESFIPHSKFIFLTEIKKEFIGDVYFPKFNKDDFLEVQRSSNTENDINFDFVVYRRK